MSETPAAEEGRVRRAVRLVMGRAGGQVGLVVFLVLVGYFFGIRGMRFLRVPSASMEPTLMRGDQLVTLRESVYRRGDIVVVRDTEEGGYMVKRIAGIGPDELLVRDGALYINGAYASEPYVEDPMVYNFPKPFRVPDGEAFLLGDNRNDSYDSSVDYHTVPLDDVVGKVVFIYFPYERWGPVRSYPLEPTGR